MHLVLVLAVAVAVLGFNFPGDVYAMQLDARTRLEMGLSNGHAEKRRLRTLRPFLPVFLVALRLRRQLVRILRRVWNARLAQLLPRVRGCPPFARRQDWGDRRI